MPDNTASSSDARPNIVMLICHDLGRHVGHLGAPVDTPEIDGLARDGVTFSNYFCTAAQCSPSRGSIMTGRYPHNNGLIGLAHIGWEIGAQEVTLPMYLNAAGYSTHLLGHQHEHTEPARLGYRHIDQSSQQAAGVAEMVTAFLQDRVREPDRQPFFVSAGITEPHRPYRCEGYPRDDEQSIEVLPYLPDRPGIREDMAGLHGLIWVVDECVGRIRNALDETGLAKDTLFIFTTDHGIAMPRAKGTCYDPGLGTVLTMHWPGHFEGGQRYEELLTNCDLLPTILDLVAMPTPDGLDGRSFLPLLEGEQYQARDDIYAEMTWHDKYNPMRAIRTNRYKYIRNFGQRPLVYLPKDVWDGPAGEEMRDEYYASSRPEEELYDLDADPWEQDNIIDDPGQAEIAEQLRQRVADWMMQTNDPLLYGEVSPSTKQRERLEADDTPD